MVRLYQYECNPNRASGVANVERGDTVCCCTLAL